MMPIGTVSKRTGVHIETIRYYERTGLIPRPRRGENGRRIYGEEDVDRLIFIRHARDMGFEMPSVRALLALQSHPSASCRTASKLAAAQLAAIELRIVTLSELRDELVRMVKACRNDNVGTCRVMKTLTKPLNVSRSAQWKAKSYTG